VTPCWNFVVGFKKSNPLKLGSFISALILVCLLVCLNVTFYGTSARNMGVIAALSNYHINSLGVERM
jgi:hypothetical protein